MCWFAHELEPFALKHIFKRRLSIIWLMIGSFIPDFFTKSFIQFGIIPVFQHRNFGIGITHTPFFGLIIGLLAYAIVRHYSDPKYAKIVFISFLIGQWFHVLLDSFDSTGCMILFPFSAQLFPLGLWSYGAQLHFWGDLFVFFHSPALLLETLWLVYVWAFAWKLVTKEYFEKEVYRNEKLWWVCNKFGAWKSEAKMGMRILYTFFFIGGLRLLVWVTYVWAVYEPTPDARRLASQNYGAEFWSNYIVFIFAIALMLIVIAYATWQWWKRVDKKFYVLPAATIGALLLVSLIPMEPIASNGAHAVILIACALAIVKWDL